MGKAKGTIVVKAVKVLRGHKEAARKALPESLHHYLKSTILSSTWYEEAEYLELCRACAQVLSRYDGNPWELMGKVSAEIDLEEIYRSQLRPGDPLASLRNFQTVWRLHHDTGKVTVTSESPGRASVELTDYAIVSSEMCRSIGGHIRGTLSLAGAENIRLSKSLCRATGDPVCRWDARWQSRSP